MGIWSHDTRKPHEFRILRQVGQESTLQPAVLQVAALTGALSYSWTYLKTIVLCIACLRGAQHSVIKI